jgi:hypothetical protein
MREDLLFPREISLAGQDPFEENQVFCFLPGKPVHLSLMPIPIHLVEEAIGKEGVHFEGEVQVIVANRLMKPVA